MPSSPSYDFALSTAGPAGGASCFVSLGTECRGEPPPLFFAALYGTRQNISSQIAVQMSIDAFVERAQETAASPPDSSLPLASVIVREAFKEANTRVYQYAHRMGAGGTMGAVGAAACYHSGRFTMARVGPFAGYFLRKKETTLLFEQSEKQSAAGTLTRFIGANAQILVDMATLEISPGDLLAFTSLPDVSTAVAARLSAGGVALSDRAHSAVQDALSADPELSDRPVILSLLELLRPTIVLRQVFEE